MPIFETEQFAFKLCLRRETELFHKNAFEMVQLILYSILINL